MKRVVFTDIKKKLPNIIWEMVTSPNRHTNTVVFVCDNVHYNKECFDEAVKWFTEYGVIMTKAQRATTTIVVDWGARLIFCPISSTHCALRGTSISKAYVDVRAEHLDTYHNELTNLHIQITCTNNEWKTVNESKIDKENDKPKTIYNRWCRFVRRLCKRW